MTPATKALPTKVKCEFESVLNLLSYYTNKQEHVPSFFAWLWRGFFARVHYFHPLQVFWLEMRDAHRPPGESLCTGSHLDSTA